MMGRFFRALHTGAGPGVVSTGTRPHNSVHLVRRHLRYTLVRTASQSSVAFCCCLCGPLAVSPWLNATAAALGVPGVAGSAAPLVVATRADDRRGRARSGLAPQPWCWATVPHEALRGQTPASSGRRPGVLKEPEPQWLWSTRLARAPGSSPGGAVARSCRV